MSHYIVDRVFPTKMYSKQRRIIIVREVESLNPRKEINVNGLNKLTSDPSIFNGRATRWGRGTRIIG